MTLRNAQKPKLETRVALIEQRVNDLVERHETVPGRVTRLEGEFEHMGAQLAALNDGQRELTATVADIGTKVTRMLAALTVLGVVAQSLGPTLFRMLFP
ncbi:hypothetical protein [Pseudomonas monteilii]|uniref:hypothetical protein n=1 Tax=Pseudomonas monteilii TaxID=76759 RepID=UPI0015FA20FA|nr:hypothetical protein [Pseudomonas monteilii]MBA6102460.1 hypothetical protein [Pseudomonas monteilii]